MNEPTNRSEESKKRILLAAAEIFSHKGLDGARVDEIAYEANINKRMIYHYFGSKENLYVEVLRYNYNKINILGQEVFARDLDPKGNAVNALRRYFYFLAGDRQFVRLVSWEALNHGRYASKVLPQALEVAHSELAEILQEGIRQGVFKEDLDIRHVLLSVHAICLVYFTRREVVQHMWTRDTMTEEMLEQRLQHIIDFVFNGILA